MSRNPHPRTIEELEHDAAVSGLSERREEHRILVELNWQHLQQAAHCIASSRALLAEVRAKFLADEAPGSTAGGHLELISGRR
jgi:hypothetical protein